MAIVTIRYTTTDDEYVVVANRADRREEFLRGTARMLRLCDEEAATLSVEAE